MTFSVAESKYSKLSNPFSHNSHGTHGKTIISQIPFTFDGVLRATKRQGYIFCAA